jgi:predicted HTH transcriptional regulator
MPEATNDALAQAREILEGRLKELDDERRQIERALAEVSGGKAGRRGPGRPRGSRNRRRGSTRADQAAGLVKSTPGISASEIAKQLKIAPNYMYRVMSDLVNEGRVQKRGRGYHPA